VPPSGTATRQRAPDAAPTASATEVQARILEYLGSIAKLATQEEIIANVGAPGPQVLFALKGLRLRSRVLEVGRGTIEEPYLYTGCSVLRSSSASPWLHKVRPWRPLASS
jgi:hypothetical protein